MLLSFSCGGGNSTSQASVDSNLAARVTNSQTIDQNSVLVSQVGGVFKTGTASYLQGFDAFLDRVNGHPTMKFSELLRGKVQKFQPIFRCR